MSAATAVAEKTFVVEYSYEAMTLDYTAPQWYPVADLEPFTDEEAAQQARLDYSEGHLALTGGSIATRVRTIVAPRPEAGYVDHFLEAEFAANRMYWAGRAAEAERQKEAEREMYRLYGKGASVKVVKGRKVPIGTEGEVFWLGEKQWGMRLGFKDAEGTTHWTALDNVESTTPAFEKES